jgi:septal ring factor EnvC (AmiA/AmiB activator)
VTRRAGIRTDRADRRRPQGAAFLLAALLAAALTLAAVRPSFGQDRDAAAPDPDPARSLEEIRAEAEAMRAREAELADLAAEGESALEALRAELIASSQRVMLLHHELIALDRELEELAAREADRAAALETERRRLAASAGALYRLARVPPALVMAGPGDPESRVRTAAVLGGLVPRLAERTRAGQQALAELAALRDTLEARRQERDGIREELAVRLASLAGRIDRRQELLQDTRRRRDEAAQDAAALSAEARSLQTLLHDLSEGRTDAAAPDPNGPADVALASPLTRPMLPLATYEGVVLPTSGMIVGRFGERGRFGGASQGIRLSAYPGAPVVAPLDGTVRYAGAFEPYGQILILEHSGGYHSLIAGLGRIDAAEGQGVLAGEPVAVTPSPTGRQIGAPTLYYELRLNGRPVDPIRGLLRAQERGQG